MGAAGGAFFCKNGHMTDCWGHHEYSEFDTGYLPANEPLPPKPKCEFCGEPATHFIAHGFEDSDFDQSEMPQVIRKERLTSLEDGTVEEVEIFDGDTGPRIGQLAMNMWDIDTGENLGHTCDVGATLAPGQTVAANIHVNNLEPGLSPGDYSFTAVIGAVGEQTAP